MSDISKAEKLARAVDNVKSGGRAFDRQLAAQISMEFRAQATRIAELEAALSAIRKTSQKGSIPTGARMTRMDHIAMRALFTKEPTP